MMGRELVLQQTIETEEGKRYLLEYYLLSDVAEVPERYGVSIIKTGEGCYESQSIRELSPIKSQALRFLYMLGEGKVTPVSLFDVADNFLSCEYAY